MFRLIVLIPLSLLACPMIAHSQEAPPRNNRLPPAAHQAGRSVVMAKNGMVATSQALAAQIGLDTLRRRRRTTARARVSRRRFGA